MPLNCFFGVELQPDGVAYTPIIPPRSSLVISQCAVTSCVPPGAADAAYEPVTLYVQGPDQPTRFALCTLDPANGVVTCPLQVLFSKSAHFTLVPQPPKAAGAAGGRSSGKAAEPKVVCPAVHVTGYYEEDLSDADEDEEDVEEEEEEFARAAPPSKKSRKEKGGEGRAAPSRHANAPTTASGHRGGSKQAPAKKGRKH